MGMERHLQDILNDVSAQLQSGKVVGPAVKPALSELHAFILCDDLLASLHKEYLDAKENRLAAQKEFGSEDGMTDMAMILEDSAWCAMQTRYMEARANRLMMKRAQSLMEDARKKQEKIKRAEEEKEALETLRNLQTISRIRKAQDGQMVALWFLILWYTKFEYMMFRAQPTHQFNKLAA